MDNRDELIKAFEFIGQVVNDKIIEKCLLSCAKYDIDVEDFVDQWSAFSITNLKSAPISLDGIALMERKELAKLNKNSLNSSISKETTPKNTSRSLKRPHSPEKVEEVKSVVKPTSVEVQSTQEEVIEPDATQPSYAERSDSGQVVVSHGPKKEFTHSDTQVTVNIISKSDWYDYNKFRYLHATQSKVSNAFNSAVDYLTDIINKKRKLGATNYDNNTSKSNNDTVYGRIRSEDQGKLNANTVKLEGSYMLNNGRVMTLNISKTNRFNLFPGQIVAAEGINVGHSFMVQDFFTDGVPDFHCESPNITDDLQIVFAAGPYTTSDNFLYEPLQDLLTYVATTKPNVLILLGPFIDVSHNGLIDMTETFETCFDNLIQTIMECFKFDIQVILIPSSKDAHHFPIYPSPAYQMRQNYPNLLCAPNPCMLNINGVVIGTSSTDILFHLTKVEISRQPQNTDRMARLASHLLQQRSFYPLYPSDKGVIDYRMLLNDCQIEVKPHILILPSTLRYCVKEVEGCLFINPERLVKNRVGGTFATISISPTVDSVKIVNNISCQIRKI